MPQVHSRHRYLIAQNSPSRFTAAVFRLLDLMDDDHKFGFLLLALGMFAVVGFVLAFEFGWIEMIGD